MFRPLRTLDLTGLWDPLLAVVAVAYLLGFVAAVHAALGKLFY